MSAVPRGLGGRRFTDHGRRGRIRRLGSVSLDVPWPDTSPDGLLPTGLGGAVHDRRAEPEPGPGHLPAGRPVELPGRGTTWVHEADGPPGAPTLMLLHGWTVTAGINWFPSFPELSRRYRVVALDHRGHGRGVRSPVRFRLEDCADDVAALADVLGLDTFVPVGYSMGGPVAQLVWRRHADRVDGIVLCATSRNFSGTPMERAMFSAFGGLSLAARVTPDQWRRELNARLQYRRYDDSDLGRWARQEVARNDPRALIEAAHALGRYSSHDWIDELDVPAAVIVTEKDAVVPPERQRRLAESIPGAATWSVAGDHSACVMLADRFVPALVEACAHVTGAG